MTATVRTVCVEEREGCTLPAVVGVRVDDGELRPGDRLRATRLGEVVWEGELRGVQVVVREKKRRALRRVRGPVDCELLLFEPGDEVLLQRGDVLEVVATCGRCRMPAEAHTGTGQVTTDDGSTAWCEGFVEAPSA